MLEILDSRYEVVAQGIESLEVGPKFESIQQIVDLMIIAFGGKENILALYPDREKLGQDISDAELREALANRGVSDDFAIPAKLIPRDRFDEREDYEDEVTIWDVVQDSLFTGIIERFLDAVYGGGEKEE